MTTVAAGTVAVCGATGRQGGAVARRLLESGWNVRALTRKPDGRAARALAASGATVVKADMNVEASLRAAFDGAVGVYSVQNGMVSGFDAEVAQGRNVAQAAKAVGVRHLVYGSAGTGRRGTGVPSWESKIPVEEQLRGLDVAFTILRPVAFMELMTDRSFHPELGTWRIWPRLSGAQKPIYWLALQDLGAIATIAFSQPDAWAGREVTLAADGQSLAECRRLYRDALGREPRSVPVPLWLFDRFTRGDLTKMWRWVGTHDFAADPAETRAILPSALTVAEWLRRSARPHPDRHTHDEHGGV